MFCVLESVVTFLRVAFVRCSTALDHQVIMAYVIMRRAIFPLRLHRAHRLAWVATMPTRCGAILPTHQNYFFVAEAQQRGWDGYWIDMEVSAHTK